MLRVFRCRQARTESISSESESTAENVAVLHCSEKPVLPTFYVSEKKRRCRSPLSLFLFQLTPLFLLRNRQDYETGQTKTLELSRSNFVFDIVNLNRDRACIRHCHELQMQN
jgi:hypothetical protein